MDLLKNEKINKVYIQKIDFFVIFDFISNAIYENLKDLYNCEIKDSLENITLNQNDLIIVYGQFAWKYTKYITIKPININIICINAEPIYMNLCYDLDTLENISLCSYNTMILLDYNIKNIDYINNSNLSNKIKTYFVPWTYNKYISKFPKLENYKDIDILFLGHTPINSRRHLILTNLMKKNDELKTNFKIEFQHNMGKGMNYTYEQLNRAKIIINIFQHENNRIFDFYRFNILLSNKFFFISEDFDIDENNEFKDYKDYIITTKYDNLVDTIFNYLINFSNEEINKIVDKSFNWYKNILNFDFELLKIISKI
jgi:hypothetical protein